MKKQAKPKKSASISAVLEKREHEIVVSRRALREKERMLATLMSNLDGMVYRCRNDAQWTMEFVSDGCFGLTGYRPDELLHNTLISFEQIEHPEDRAHVREEIEAALRERRRFFVEYRIQCRDGEIRWVWERGVGIYNKRGAVVTIEGFIENVTERKVATQALQQAERSFRSIFENATEGIFQTSPDGRFLNVNPALAGIYGYATPDELIASIGDIQHQIYTDPARRTEFMRLMQDAGAVTNFVSEIRRKDGARIWISENARAVLDENGNLLFSKARWKTSRRPSSTRKSCVISPTTTR